MSDEAADTTAAPAEASAPVEAEAVASIESPVAVDSTPDSCLLYTSDAADE